MVVKIFPRFPALQIFPPFLRSIKFFLRSTKPTFPNPPFQTTQIPKSKSMDDDADGSAIPKTICSICYEDLKPILEDLQSISICGHVFHELCLQQWFEYCSNGKKNKYSCPMCKQSCVAKDVARLYFQSIGDANDSMLLKKPTDWVERDPELLRTEVKRLEMKVSVLNSTLEHQGKDLKQLNQELQLCQDEVKKEVGLRSEAMKQKALMSQLLHMKSEELDKSTIECKRLNERSMALAKELAAFKLVSELDLDEEEILKLSSLGSGADNKDTIDILRKSLVLRNRSYKELMAKCNHLGRGEARSCKKLEKAKEKINKLKVRVQELEKAIEDKDNEVLRGLKDAKKASTQGGQSSMCCKCNMIPTPNKPAGSSYASGSTASQINETPSSRKRKSFELAGDVCPNDLNLVDTVKDMCSSKDKKTLELSKVEHANLNPNLQRQTSDEEADRRPYHPQLTSCNLVRKKAAESTINVVNNIPSTPTVNNAGRAPVPGDECMPLAVEDTAECEPVLINIRRESSSDLTLNKPGDICFSGGLLGPDGSNRYLGKWCKRGQTNGSGATQSSHSGELIIVGADGRGGQIKVLRSQNESLTSQTTSSGAKRCKNGVKNVNMRMEHFFSKC